MLPATPSQRRRLTPYPCGVATRERAICPWGCGRDVAVSGGFPMPHNKSIFSSEKCRPPAEWGLPAPPVAPAPEPVPEPPQRMGNCIEYPECGMPAGRGHPKSGWVHVKVAGKWSGGVWFCSTQCTVDALSDPDAEPHPPAQTTATALAALNRLAGVHLSVMTATPVRVQRALDAAFARLVEEVAATARWDARDRPTTVDLLAELGADIEETA